MSVSPTPTPDRLDRSADRGQDVDGVEIRRAGRADVESIVALLADDPLGAQREDLSDLGTYLAAFERIDADPAQLLVVATRGDTVVGTFQLTFTPGLSRKGTSRAVIEAVRVAASERGSGLGTRLITWAIGEAEDRGAAMVQLTSDASRTDAHRFYERLGFAATHVGFKKTL